MLTELSDRLALIVDARTDGAVTNIRRLSAEEKAAADRADVLKAKQEGQAALERARGESASLRNLANAARVLEGNPALMNLRLLQSLTAAQNSGNTLVLGVPCGFVPLKNGRAAAGEANENSDKA